MKTFAALIRRYVLATAAIVLLVGGLLVGQIFYVGFKSLHPHHDECSYSI